MSFFNLHTHRYTQEAATLELVNQYPWAFNEDYEKFSIGIHPWYLDESRLQQDLDFMTIKMSDPNCLAVGECGLDKRIEIPMEVQQVVFEKQLLLAQEYNKPVVLHCVAAFDEVMATKKRLNITVPMIVHGYSKNEQLAKQLINNGFYLSFGKYLVRNPGLETVFLSVPDDRIFLETDTIDEDIADVYALAAKYKKQTIAELQQTIEHNFQQVFKTS
ncbi:hydrolase TatD [Flavobacterium faecale]|uniref:Hydrolase TatD n=1 Tax=Flavobacterium faecale TaxID=1355330 RepID=A0A2S1LEP8_9FLAO|nr:TatD family hydrolase [Flavobacterium faecale]AWG22223.1 hydrolase TatD [Flavobacterium faecale]